MSMQPEMKALLEKAKLEYEQEVQTTQGNIAQYEQALEQERSILERVQAGLDDVKRLLKEYG